MVLGLLLLMACEATPPLTDPNGCSDAEASRCAKATRAAQELLDIHAACRTGEECVAVSQPDLGIPCSPTLLFYCPFAVNERTDVAAFLARASQLRADAEVCPKCGGPCAIPVCVATELLRPVCDTVAGRCRLVLK